MDGASFLHLDKEVKKITGIYTIQDTINALNKIECVVLLNVDLLIKSKWRNNNVA